MKFSMLKCVFMLVHGECVYVHMFMHVYVGEYITGGRCFPVTALSVSHCSAKLFATLHD